MKKTNRLIKATQARARSQTTKLLQTVAHQPSNSSDRGRESRSSWKSTILTLTPFYSVETQISWSFFAGLQEINVSFQTHSQIKWRKQTNLEKCVNWGYSLDTELGRVTNSFYDLWNRRIASQPLMMATPKDCWNHNSLIRLCKQRVSNYWIIY